jgi:hypothetical protein
MMVLAPERAIASPMIQQMQAEERKLVTAHANGGILYVLQAKCLLTKRRVKHCVLKHVRRERRELPILTVKMETVVRISFVRKCITKGIGSPVERMGAVRMFVAKTGLGQVVGIRRNRKMAMYPAGSAGR